MKQILFIIGSFFVLQSVHAKVSTEYITIQKGETYHLELPSNKTTGYSWYFAKLIPKNSAIELVDSGYNPPKTGLIGGSGKQYWDIQAKRHGKTHYILEYKREWEKNTKPIEIKKFVFIVE